MTRKEFTKNVKKCPDCGNKPKGFSVRSVLKDNFLEETMGNRTKSFYIVKCGCGKTTHGYLDRNQALNDWNNQVYFESDIIAAEECDAVETKSA